MSALKVFLSHATEDADLAHRLACDLEGAGFEVWIAPESIRPGEAWVDAINRGLQECETLVLVLTAAAVQSPWVNHEVSAAIMLEREGQMRIVPLRIEECEIPPLWRAYQFIPFTEYEAGLRVLLKVLSTHKVPSLESPLVVEPLQVLTPETGVYSIAFSPDGSMLVAGLRSGTIWRWNSAEGTPLEPIQAHQKTVHCVAFHPDGNWLASASGDQSIRLWTMPDGTLRQMLEGHTDSVRAVSFSPDGRLLASGSRDATLRLWTIPDGMLVRVLQGHEKSVYDIAFAPDGGTIASVSSDNTVRLWSVESGESTELGKLESTILSGNFSPDGKLLATGTWAGFIRLWNVTTCAKGRLLEGHNDRVHRLLFSPDGALLISSSKDTTIRLWTIPEGKGACPPLALHTGWVRGLALSPDGTLLASGDTDGMVRLWRVHR